MNNQIRTQGKPPLLTQKMIHYANTQPQRLAYTLVNQQRQPVNEIRYGALHQRACFVAGFLTQKNLNQEPIILCYPTGIEFMIAMLACLYSGVIAIPIHLASLALNSQALAWVEAIIVNAKVKAILTNHAIFKELAQKFTQIHPEIEIFDLISSQPISSLPSTADFIPIPVTTETISHLQYTSGSTSSPRAVISRHQHLSHSLYATAKRWGYTPDSVTVSWTPHGHVYGLTAGLLLPLYSGSQAVLMSPQDFLMNPAMWLQTISTFKGTHSGCPNFGYDHCVAEIDEADSQALNLSSWQIASNGGEVISPRTLQNFFDKFKSYGFQFESFRPAYGMSECTGLIASPTAMQNPKTTVSSVSCGPPLEDIDLKIVDPMTQQQVEPGLTAEIWLSGPMCSLEYWNSTESISATLSGEKAPIYLRTGDLGFIKNNELYLVGRLKECIKIAGKTYYPSDIEMALKKDLGYLSGHTSIVFSKRIDETEALFVLQEVDILPEQTYRKIVSTIRRVLSLNYGIDAHTIALLPKFSLPTSGVGKIKRQEAMQLFFNQAFKTSYATVKTMKSSLTV